MATFTNKSELISSMRSGNNLDWDIIIIGGGITGAGILREAVRRGYKSLLIEKKDFSWGTSSRSSKMIHGGLRYLAAGDYKLTKESVQERQRLLKEAPGLIYPISFFFSFRKGLFPGPWVMRLILLIYDWFARKKDHRFYKNSELSKKFTNLDQDNLNGAVAYTDAMVDDSRLVLRLLQDSISFGATAINYTEIREFITIDSKVVGVNIRDEKTNSDISLKSSVVINATGAWADEVRKTVSVERKVRPLRGSHIVIPSSVCPITDVFAFLHPKDKRGVYVYPWENQVIIGTTDLDHAQNLDIEPSISSKELQYLLDGFNSQFKTSKLGKKDIISTWAGVRPVIGSDKSKDPSKERRDHVVWNDKNLITVSGGKLTTFRLIAIDVLNQAKNLLPEPKEIVEETVFHTPKNTGTHLDWSNHAESKRLLGRFGHKATEVIKLSEECKTKPLEKFRYLMAECRWAILNEAVEHLDDLMLRRTRVGMCLPNGGQEVLPDLKNIFLEEKQWTLKKWNDEVQNYLQIWQNYYSLPQKENASS